MPRKRTHDEMVASEPAAMPHGDELLHRIRNMWELAALYEFIHLFGAVVKLQPMDIEDLEAECTKPAPHTMLEEIGLTILKFVSSRRDLTIDNWDETVRRQYEHKKPGRPHPYGPEEEPVNRFRDFHVYTKLRVLFQLAQWCFHNPDRMRQHFPDMKEADFFFDWQAHPCGWDRQDRQYYRLQGNRLYRRTDPPISEPEKKRPKYTSKKAQAQRRKDRASKRRRIADSEDDDTEMADADETMPEARLNGNGEQEQNIADTDPDILNTFGDYKWECVAITREEYRSFLDSMAKSKDLNERNLRSLIEEDVMAELDKQEERKQRKMEARLREVQMAEKMLGAKRSGRLAAKQEREREEAEAAETERHKQALLAEAHKEEERQHKMENERQSRMLTREQRIKEREYKRVLMEEQIARDAEEAERIEQEGARGSRHLKERLEQKKKELEEFSEDEWTFDCSGCGQHGKNWDDGEHSIACERCNVWQHSKCLGFSKSAAESDDFHFVCKDCRRKDDEANRPKISLKFKVGQSSSPPQPVAPSPGQTEEESPVKQKLVSVDVPPLNAAHRPSVSGSVVNGQFYPAPDPSRFQPPAPAQPFAPIHQPSMPQYAVKQAQRQPQYMNGSHPSTNSALHTYPPHERLPGSTHAQNLYSQVAYPTLAPQPQHASPPSQPSQLPPFRPSSSHSQTPRPPSSHSLANGHSYSSPIRQRIPSPIVNRPTMSPTQGNPDVGPIAGVPGRSPSLQPALMATPFTNGSNQYTNGMPNHSTPNQQPLSRGSSFSAPQPAMTQPVSGLSPTKPRISASPLPQPSLVPQKQGQGVYRTPSSSFNNAGTSRSVSGTPIFPPAENLAPSPQQLNREPVPTPSKHSPPLSQGEGFGEQPVSDDRVPQQQQQPETVQ